MVNAPTQALFGRPLIGTGAHATTSGGNGGSASTAAGQTGGSGTTTATNGNTAAASGTASSGQPDRVSESRQEPAKLSHAQAAGGAGGSPAARFHRRLPRHRPPHPTASSTTGQNPVTATVPVGGFPDALAVAPNGHGGYNVYVGNAADGTVSVINPTTNTTVGNPISLGIEPLQAVASADGSHVYFAGPTTVAPTNGVIDVVALNTATQTVSAPITIPTPSAVRRRWQSPQTGRNST